MPHTLTHKHRFRMTIVIRLKTQMGEIMFDKCNRIFKVVKRDVIIATATKHRHKRLHTPTHTHTHTHTHK